MPAEIDLETRSVSRAAVLPAEYRGIKARPSCEVGDSVAFGAPLLRDEHQPALCIPSPLAGRVVDIRRAARRRLEAVIVEADARAEEPAAVESPGHDSAALREFLAAQGAWCSLRTRPFGNVPRLEAEPAAVFVGALDAEPGAPDPQMLIEACSEEFAAGVTVLADICSAPVYVCHAEGRAPVLETSERVRCVGFSGGSTAGLPGVHIHALCPIGFAGKEVWQLGYQDVIAWGWLVLHGKPWKWRLLALSGNGIRRPRSLLVPPGAAIDELLAGEMIDGPTRIFAGSSLCGRELGSARAFLAPGQRQLSVFEAARSGDSTAPLAGAALIPGEALEELAPPGIHPVPLMRALQLGDAERARELGALELLEEDVAPLSQACVSRSDYGLLLRRVLTQLQAGT